MKEISLWKKKLHRLLLKIENRFSKWRKRIIVDPEMHFWISQPLKQADKFLLKLYEDDDFYLSTRYAWTTPEDAKKLFLYGCIRQVVKASVTLLENMDYILEPPKSKNLDTLERNIIEAIIDIQNSVLRKHIELLVNLINFSSFDKKEAYRIFLNAENLEYSIARQFDFGTFYESKSGNINHSIQTFSDRINNDLKGLSVKDIWFLKKDWNKRKNPPIFESVRRRFMSALPYATDDEKIAMGVSYNEFFAKFSTSLHASAGSRISEKDQKFGTIKKNITFISLLGQHIMNRANGLMGFDDSNDYIQKRYREGTSEASKLMKRNRRIFCPGDLVLAMGDLCETIECKQSRYGYTSCKIKFLTRPPLPETPDDWLPAAFVAMVLPKSKVRQFLFKSKDSPDTPKELKDTLNLMEKETDDNLMGYAKGATIKLYQKGILIPMLLDSGIIKRIEDLDEEF